MICRSSAGITPLLVPLAALVLGLLAFGSGCGDDGGARAEASGGSGGLGGKGGDAGGAGSGGSGGSFPCAYESLDIGSKADADRLLTQGCDSVAGDLIIQFSDLEDLNRLSSVRRVEGTVQVEHNHALGSLDGLGQIESIAGDLHISGNSAVAPSVGFDSLRTVGGDLSVRINAKVTEVGLGALESVGGKFIFQSNPELPTCDIESLRQRIEVGGQFIVAGNSDC